MATAAAAAATAPASTGPVAADNATAARTDRHNLKFMEEMPEIDPGTIQILQTYSKIPSDQINTHLRAIRDQAWAVFQYPCIGQWRLYDLAICNAPRYAEVLQRVKNGDKILDLGCCIGQDVRRLVVDGAPPENIVGSDLEAPFFDIGYDLFRDRDTLPTPFIQANIFYYEKEADKLKTLENSLDIIHASSFFHLFERKLQMIALKNTAKMLKKKPGSMIFGRQSGDVNPGDVPSGPGSDMKITKHNDVTFKQLFEDLSKETGQKWKCEVEVEEHVKWGPGEVPGRTRLRYVAWME